jgi:hypothetical protein
VDLDSPAVFHRGRAVNDETKQAIADTVNQAEASAEETVKQPAVRKLALLGFIGALAFLLVSGYGGKIADPTGAISAIASERFGRIVLLIFVIGAFGHGVWNILRGTGDVDNAGRSWQGIVRRVFSIGIGIFYLGLAVSAIEIIMAVRSAGENSRAEETFVAILIAIPILGVLLLALIGLGLIGAGLHECYSGFTGKYQESYRLWEITGFHLSLINALGVLSFTARAVLLLIMGYFYIRAAYYNDAGGSIGLDASLLALLSSTYGPLLVGLAAVGLISHGVLAFYEARYRRIC